MTKENPSRPAKLPRDKTFTLTEQFNRIEVQLYRLKKHQFERTRSYIRIIIIYLYFSEYTFGNILLHSLLIKMVEDLKIKVDGKEITNPTSKFIRSLKLMQEMKLIYRIDEMVWGKHYQLEKHWKDEELLEYYLSRIDPVFTNSDVANEIGETNPGVRKIKEWVQKNLG